MLFHIPEETSPPEVLAVLSIGAGKQGEGENKGRVKE